MLGNINEPVILPVGSNNFCQLVLNLQKYTREGFVGFTANWRELELTTTIKADYSKQYPTFVESTKGTYWNFNPTTNTRTSIQYTIDYQDRPAQFYGRYFKPPGYNIWIANAYYEGRGEYAWAMEGKEFEMYNYITNVMNKPWNNATGGFQFWSNTIIGINKFTISNGICYLPDNTTAPPLALQLPEKPKLYLGNAAPPPPPPNMNCCDCNTISTILAEQIIAEAKQHEATRELIDRRTIEALREINKMLQGMQIDLNLQPIIDRLNELEANLWNGLKAGG